MNSHRTPIKTRASVCRAELEIHWIRDQLPLERHPFEKASGDADLEVLIDTSHVRKYTPKESPK